jgi:TetR/AcrR family transcriptional regulator
MTTRERIIDTALELFCNRGYDSVGVQEICEHSAVTKPTLYHHFSSKRGLLAAVIETYNAELWASLGPALEYYGDLSASLEATVSVFLRYARARPAFMRLMLTLEYAPAESEARSVVAPYAAELVERVRDLFARAASDHGNMRGREEPYAVSFLGTVFTYVLLILEGRIPLDEALPYQVMHQFSHGIYS